MEWVFHGRHFGKCWQIQPWKRIHLLSILCQGLHNYLLFSSHRELARGILLLFPCYRWGNWGLGQWYDLPKVGCGRFRFMWLQTPCLYPISLAPYLVPRRLRIQAIELEWQVVMEMFSKNVFLLILPLINLHSGGCYFSIKTSLDRCLMWANYSVSPNFFFVSMGISIHLEGQCEGQWDTLQKVVLPTQ